jgi:hypothetical protein
LVTFVMAFISAVLGAADGLALDLLASLAATVAQTGKKAINLVLGFETGPASIELTHRHSGLVPAVVSHDRSGGGTDSTTTKALQRWLTKFAVRDS